MHLFQFHSSHITFKLSWEYSALEVEDLAVRDTGWLFRLSISLTRWPFFAEYWFRLMLFRNACFIWIEMRWRWIPSLSSLCFFLSLFEKQIHFRELAVKPARRQAEEAMFFALWFVNTMFKNWNSAFTKKTLV